ncbi:MAG TPA: LysR family transcriptional regulator [Polyangia bacterium]|jgi:DNA-binding transcriptional LysR family regulator|nr:LysR family transcriptional regulator [Polyangia bacterium]
MNISGLNLNLLPVLDALLTERSVSRAGTRLGLSQPAVSNALAQLRELLHDPLFVRKSGGMAPTERALALAGPLRAALLALELGLEPSASFDPATTERDFTIVTNDFVAFAMLPGLLARLQREAPRVRLQVRAWQEHVVPPDLARGDADLVLGFNRGLPPGHHAAPLFQDRFIFVARKGHPAVPGKITLATYTKLAHVLVSQEPNARGVVDDVLAQRGLTRNVALRVSHFLLVPPIVAATNYVAALSEIVARTMVTRLPLQLLKMPLDVAGATVQMMWHGRTDASEAHHWLRALVEDVGRGIESSCKKVSKTT